MDTDFLTEMVYEVMRIADDPHLWLRGQIGVSARDYNDEEEFLYGTLEATV